MDKPLINWANPKTHETFRFYVDGKIAVRELNSGVVQIKTGYGDWREVSE